MTGPRIDPVWVILAAVYLSMAVIGFAWWAVQ